MNGFVFVYGTLKTRQKRARQWPLAPRSIRPAWTLGRLLDTGPYPAMLDGTDRIAGQLWEFRPEDMQRTFEVLDQIEGTNQPGLPNDYDRVIQTVFTHGEDATCEASTYRFARFDLIQQFEYIEPHIEFENHLYSIWPRACKWEV